jgi:hypothetical protein
MSQRISVGAPITDIIRMVHTLGLDADGDYVPCSVKKSLYAAQCWDTWKQQKYNQSPKAQSVVTLYWNC